MAEKPSFEDIVAYARPIIHQSIVKFASYCPHEQQTEMEQSAYLRLWERYGKVDSTRGWKSFVYNHARGAVLDYLKMGEGFEEHRWSILKPEGAQAKYRNKIHERHLAEDVPLDMDRVLASYGIFADEHSATIRWQLVARMASFDEPLHAFARWLMGHPIEKIGQVFGLNRAKASKLIKVFTQRFHDEGLRDDIWHLQTLYAFSLCEFLGVKDVDQSVVTGFPVGWNLPPVALHSEECYDRSQTFQLEFLVS